MYVWLYVEVSYVCSYFTPTCQKNIHWLEYATREQLYGMTTSLPTLQLPEPHLQLAGHYEQAKGDSFYGDQAALLLH